MNTTTPLTSRPLNDAKVAVTQRAVSQTLGGLLSPLNSRLAKAFQAHRDHPLLRPFCNIFERHLKTELDQQSFIWSDTLRLNTRVVQAIDAAPISEDEKNAAVFWLVLFHTSYFALGYQTRYLKAAPDQQTMLNLAFTQAVAHHMRSLGVKQPANSPHWEQHGYVFKPLAALQPGPNIAEEALTLLEQGTVQSADVTHTPLLQLTDLNGRVANLQDFSSQVHETFAQEMITDSFHHRVVSVPVAVLISGIRRYERRKVMTMDTIEVSHTRLVRGDSKLNRLAFPKRAWAIRPFSQ